MADGDVDARALEAREPSTEDLAFLCQKLNEVGARYLTLGGFAMRAAGYDRRTTSCKALPGSTMRQRPPMSSTTEWARWTFRSPLHHCSCG